MGKRDEEKKYETQGRSVTAAQRALRERELSQPIELAPDPWYFGLADPLKDISEAGDELSFGLVRPAAGAMGALGGALHGDFEVGKNYRRSRDSAARKMDDMAKGRETRSKVVRYGSALIPMALAPAGTVAREGLKQVGKAGVKQALKEGAKRGALEGAAQGALGGFGFSDAEDLAGTLGDMALGGTFGGVLGGWLGGGVGAATEMYRTRPQMPDGDALRQRMEALIRGEAPPRTPPAAPTIQQGSLAPRGPNGTAPSMRAEFDARGLDPFITDMGPPTEPAMPNVHTAPTREVPGGILDPLQLQTSDRIARVNQVADEMMRPLLEAQQARPTLIAHRPGPRPERTPTPPQTPGRPSSEATRAIRYSGEVPSAAPRGPVTADAPLPGAFDPDAPGPSTSEVNRMVGQSAASQNADLGSSPADPLPSRMDVPGPSTSEVNEMVAATEQRMKGKKGSRHTPYKGRGTPAQRAPTVEGQVWQGKNGDMRFTPNVGGGSADELTPGRTVTRPDSPEAISPSKPPLEVTKRTSTLPERPAIVPPERAGRPVPRAKGQPLEVDPLSRKWADPFEYRVQGVPVPDTAAPPDVMGPPKHRVPGAPFEAPLTSPTVETPRTKARAARQEQLGKEILGNVPGPAADPNRPPAPPVEAMFEDLRSPAASVHSSKAKTVAETAAAQADNTARVDPRTVEAPPAPNGLPGLNGVNLHPDLVEMGQRMRRDIVGERSHLQKVREQFSLPEHRAAPEVAALVRSLRASHHIQDVQMARVFKQLAAAEKANPKLIKAFVEQHKTGKGNIPVEALPEAWQNLFKLYRKQQEAMQYDLVKQGYFEPSQVKRMLEKGREGFVWLHRDYHAFMNRKFVPDAGRMSEAVRQLMKESGLSAEAARAQVMNFLQGDPRLSLQQRWRAFQLQTGALKNRANVPWYLRKAAGEIDSPAYVVATSMSEVERMWRQARATQAFIDMPGSEGVFWSNKPMEHLHHAPVWDESLNAFENKRLYGALAGKYVAPQLREAVMAAPAPRVQNAVSEVASSLASTWKTMKIGLSPLAYIRDFVGNSTYAAASGLPFWNPKLLPRMRQALGSMVEHGKSFATVAGSRPQKRDALWYQWALEDGAVISGMGAEFAGGSESRAIAAQLHKATEAGSLGAFIEDAGKVWGRGKAKMGAVKDSMDSVWRLAAYIEQVEKGVDRLKLSVPDARARASAIVNSNFASSGSVGHGVRQLARGSVGFLAPFLSWHVDNIRVHKNWLANSVRWKDVAQRMKQGGVWAGLTSGEGTMQAFNVATHMGAVAGLFSTLRLAAGMSDAEVAEAEAMLGQQYIENNPMREWLPFTDAKGRKQVVSLGGLFPTAMFGRGDPESSLLSRVAANIALGFVESGTSENEARNLLSSLGLDVDVPTRKKLPDDTLRPAAEAVINYLEPGVMSTTKTLMRRSGALAKAQDELGNPGAGQLKRYEESLTPGQVAARMNPVTAAFPVEPVGERSAAGVGARIRGISGEAARTTGSINRAQVPVAQRQQHLEANRRRLEALRAEQKRRAEARQKARQ